MFFLKTFFLPMSYSRDRGVNLCGTVWKHPICDCQSYNCGNKYKILRSLFVHKCKLDKYTDRDKKIHNPRVHSHRGRWLLIQRRILEGYNINITRVYSILFEKVHTESHLPPGDS